MTVYVDDAAAKAALKRERDRANQRRYREKNPERIRELSRARYAANPVPRKESHSKWFKKVQHDPAFREKANAIGRRNHAKRREREAIAVSGRPRPDVCDICDRPGRVYFDHCHITGKFRGWLCNHCNLILGHAKDDPSLLRKLAEYLGRK